MLSLKIGLFFKKNVGIWKNFWWKTNKQISYQELEKMNIGRLYA